LNHPLLSQEKLLRLIARKHMEIQRIAEENGKLKELLSQAPALLDELKELKAQNQLLRVQVMALESRRGGADGAGGGGGGSDASGGGPMYLS
jgi:mevalonate kinase